jgi:hypothetical protein
MFCQSNECFYRAHWQDVADAVICRTASLEEDLLEADFCSGNNGMDLVGHFEV